MTARMSHLQRLEAESIHIFREVAATFSKPVMLYSVGKDSSVMLRLAMKAFYPAKPPFPFLHVDTRWKFREMIEFRDNMAKELGFDLLVHINPEAIEQDISPFDHGSNLHTHITKTVGAAPGARQIWLRRRFRRRAPRRGKEPRQGAHLLLPQRQHGWDPKNQRPEMWKIYNTRVAPGESIRVFPLSNWTELDIWQYILQENIPIVPLYYAKKRPVVERDGMLIMKDDDRMELRPGEAHRRAHGALPHARLLSADRRDRIRRQLARGDRRGNADCAHIGTAGQGDRQGRSRFDGKEEAGRILLMKHTDPNTEAASAVAPS
jgi:sulfate adenylyltransferase subunit 2